MDGHLSLVTFPWLLSLSCHISKHSLLLGLLKGPAELADVKCWNLVAAQEMLTRLPPLLSFGPRDGYSPCVWMTIQSLSHILFTSVVFEIHVRKHIHYLKSMGLNSVWWCTSTAIVLIGNCTDHSSLTNSFFYQCLYSFNKPLLAAVFTRLWCGKKQTPLAYHQIPVSYSYYALVAGQLWSWSCSKLCSGLWGPG